ncbi:Yip1 family protein [Paenibacillus tarimensis]
MKQYLVKFPLRLIFHPFEGFWDLKYENKGKVRAGIIILIALMIVMIVNRQYSGFLVNYYDPLTMNSLNEIKYILVPFALWCVSNWSVTTLMDGEGKFKDIFLASAYSLVPIILIILPLTLISNVMTLEETAFYWLFNTVALLWSLFLLFIGTMTVHQYTAGKTVATMALTVVVAMIIVFLTMLMFSLIQQMIDFGYNVYREIIFRL